MESMELFDPIHRQCLGDGPEMNKRRQSFAGVVIQKQLMVFGGFGEMYTINTCGESFNPVTQVWSPLPDMKTGRFGHAGAELHDKVYLIGGDDGDCISSSVSIFDPNTSNWLSGPAMHQRRANSAVAKLDNIIVVTGGSSGCETFKVCEMSDPRQNKWTKIAPMRQAREEHVLINCNGKLYAMGGTGRNPSNSLSTVEEYDPQANQWKVVKSMNSGRSAFAAVIVPE